jgi:hypothetical protein
LTDEKPKLHSAEHRAYRELYASARQLIHRWGRLAPALRGTPAGDSLERGVAETERLLEALEPRTAAYGLHGRPLAQGVGARIADLRAAIADRGADTGLVVRFAVLDIEHLTTLLRQLAELARAREDRDLAGFCEEFLYRGPIQTALLRKLRPFPALLIGAALFSAAHLDAHGFPLRLLLGLALGYVTLRTRSIFPSMLCHGLYDTIAFIRFANRRSKYSRLP